MSKEPAPGHMIILTQRTTRGGVHVAGLFTSLAAMRAFLRARGAGAGLLYTRHDAPMDPAH